MIVLKLNVAKLDKKRFFAGKNGAIYCDLVLFENDEPDQFGNDFSVKQSQTKEERASGEKLPYVGNAKTIGTSRPSRPSEPARRQESAPATHPGDDDIPF